MANSTLDSKQNLACGILPEFQEDEETIRFTLFTNGATKEGWLDLVNNNNSFAITDDALPVVKKISFDPTKRLTRKVVILKSTLFIKNVEEPRSAANSNVGEAEVQIEAAKRDLAAPDPETTTLILSALKFVGLSEANQKQHYTVMHQPIEVDGKLYRLSLCTLNRFLNAFEELPVENKKHGKLRGYYNYAFVEKD